MPSASAADADGVAYLELLQRLSAAERAILRLLAAGASNRSIAETLDESEARVQSMVRAILIKLNCRNRPQAAVLAATLLLPLLDRLAEDAEADEALEAADP